MAICLLWEAESLAIDYGRYDDHSTEGMTRVTAHAYVNSNYGYSVQIPTGLVAWMNTAPAPNHGIRLFLGKQRSIEVDGSFDSAFLGSTLAVAQDTASAGAGQKATRSPDSLGGQPAIRVAVFGPNIRRRIIVARWFSQGDNNTAINYLLTLETNASNLPADKVTFDGIAKSFRFITRAP